MRWCTYAFNHTEPLEEVQRVAVAEFNKLLHDPDFTQSRMIYHTDYSCPMGVIYASRAGSTRGPAIHITTFMMTTPAHGEYVAALRGFLDTVDLRVISGNANTPGLVNIYTTAGFALGWTATDAPVMILIR
jgi:hypothetical protein